MKLIHLLIAGALALVSLPAQAQQARVVPSCSGVSLRAGDSANLMVDAAGNLCIAGSVAAGTNGTTAQAVQGITGGVPQNVLLPAGATTTTGALQPPTAAAGKIVDTIVALTANTSTTLVAARGTPGDRIAAEIQCDGTAVVGIDMKGGTLTSATAAPRVIPTGSYPNYIPLIATQSAITAYTGTAQTCRVTEYLR